MEKANRILITGHKGFIGTHLWNYLVAWGYDLVGYDLVDGDDVLDLDKLRKVACDAIIHLAAKCIVNESWEKPDEYFKTNILGTANVLSLGKRVILASSCAAGYPKSSPYGLSKLAGEMMNPYLSLRFANVYGPYQNPKHGRAIESFIRGAREGEINVYGNVKRDYIHVYDVIRGVKMALESDITGVVGIGTGRVTTTKDLASLVSKVFNPDCEINYLPGRKEASTGVVSIRRASKELGFESHIDLEEGLGML